MLELTITIFGMNPALESSTGLTRMVNPNDEHGRRLAKQGDDQMEMMVVLGGMMSMLVISLVLQHSSYKKVNVQK